MPGAGGTRDRSGACVAPPRSGILIPGSVVIWPPGRSPVVAELDTAGGDIAARHGLPPEPSVVTLAAALRRGHDGHSTQLLDHCHELPGGLRVLTGSPAAGEMHTAVEVISEAVPALASQGGVDVLADCGRLLGPGLPTGREGGPRSHSEPLGRVERRADALVLVTRAQLADLSHLEAWLPALRSLNGSLGVILAGPLRWRPEEVAAQFGVDVIGHLPDDRTGAEVVGGRPARGSTGRLPLVREARGIAERIASRLPSAGVAPADEPKRVVDLRGAVAGTEAVS